MGWFGSRLARWLAGGMSDPAGMWVDDEEENMVTVMSPEGGAVTTAETDLAKIYAAAKAGTYGTPSASNPILICLPAGVFALSAGLAQDTEHIHIAGRHRDLTIVQCAIVSGAMITQSANNAGISNLTLWVTSTSTASTAACLAQTNAVTVDSTAFNADLRIRNDSVTAGQGGARGIKDAYGRFDRILFDRNCGQHRISDSTGTARFFNCQAMSPNGGADMLASPSGTLFQDCYFEGEGFLTANATNTCFVHCVFRALGGSIGIHENPEGCAFVHCDMEGAIIFDFLNGNTNTIVGGRYSASDGVFNAQDIDATVQIGGQPIFESVMSAGSSAGIVPVGVGMTVAEFGTTPLYKGGIYYDDTADKYEGKEDATGKAFTTS